MDEIVSLIMGLLGSASSTGAEGGLLNAASQQGINVGDAGTAWGKTGGLYSGGGFGQGGSGLPDRAPTGGATGVAPTADTSVSDQAKANLMKENMDQYGQLNSMGSGTAGGDGLMSLMGGEGGRAYSEADNAMQLNKMFPQRQRQQWQPVQRALQRGLLG